MGMPRRLFLGTALLLVMTQVGCAARGVLVAPSGPLASADDAARSRCAELARLEADAVVAKSPGREALNTLGAGLSGAAAASNGGIIGVPFAAVSIALGLLGAPVSAAWAAHDNGRRREAAYANAMKLCLAPSELEAQLGPQDPAVARSLDALAERYALYGEDVEAERLYRRALVIQEEALGPEHEEVRQTLAAYTRTLRKLGQESEAAALEERMRPALEAAAEKEAQAVALDSRQSEGAARVVSRLDVQGVHYADAGRDIEAAVFYRRALATADETPETDPGDVASVLEHYADLLRRANREADAIELEARAKVIREQARTSPPAESGDERKPEHQGTP